MGWTATPRRWLIASAIVLAFLGCIAGYRFVRSHTRLNEMVLRHAVDRGASADDMLLLTPLFPTTTVPAHVFKGNFRASPQIVRLRGREAFLLVLPSSGSVAALDLRTGALIWEVSLPHTRTQEVEVRAAPLQTHGQLMVVYTTRDRTDGATTHRAAVIDLREGAVNHRFADLVFTAETPAADGGKVIFDPEWHLPRSIAHIPASRGLGRAYVSFGANQDQGAWHGWLFEVDLDLWRRGSPERAISSVFATTREADCDDGTNGKLCGGGIWAYAGPQIYRSRSGYEILVQTGNGRLDLERESYAQSLLRVTPELKFDPECDRELCATGNPREPSSACLATCRNLFVPRLLPDDAPLRPADGSCDGKSYLQCLDINDWDFGSSSPVRVETGGRAFLVTAGKAGDVYLLDADRLGILYDRRQAIEPCGIREAPCKLPNEGLTMTQPVAVVADGSPVVVIPTYNTDDVHAAGVIAYRIRIGADGPKLEEAWRVPSPAAPESRQWFRAPPTRPVVQWLDGDAIVWVADNGRDGRILGIRVKDGRVLANMRAAGWPMRNARPVLYNNVLYLPAAVQDREDLTWIEAYAIVRRSD